MNEFVDYVWVAFLTAATVICWAAVVFGAVWLIKTALAADPALTPWESTSRPTDGTATLQDGHTTTEWPVPRGDVSKAVKDAMLTGAGLYIPELKKFDAFATLDRAANGRLVRKVDILTCSDPSMWYYDAVGTRAPLMAIWKEGYFVRCPDGTTNIVKNKDGRIVHEWEPTK